MTGSGCIVLLLGSLALSSPAIAQIPNRPTNLKVLPKGLSTDSVVAVMRDLTGALGTRCVFCHVGKDTPRLDSINFASDDKESKRKARVMIRLVGTINRELDRRLPGRAPASLKVSCITCHRGSVRPLMLEDTLETTLVAASLDSAVGLYRALRERSYGRFAWDFGERSLNVLSNRLLRSGRLLDARRVLELNAEHFPNSWNVAYLLAGAHVRLGERDPAITQYRKALDLLKPIQHEGARRRLDSLLARPP